MNVAILGATGNVGTRLIAELVSRGHQVTAIARHPESITATASVKPVVGDIADESALARLLIGHDAAIHSVKFLNTDAAKVIAATKQAGVARLLVVGGAGSLEVAPGVRLIDAPNFPEEYKAEASAGGTFLEALKNETELDWTFLSPSALLLPGERTGKFRLGKDELLVGADGQSRISMEDYVIALVDELETPHHSRARFTVGY